MQAVPNLRRRWGWMPLAAFLMLALPGTYAMAAEKLIIGTSYKVLLSTPDQDGMLDLIAKEAFRRLGLSIELPYLPTERSLMAANEGLHDGELNRVAGLEKLYPNLVRVDEPMMIFEFVGFTKNSVIQGGDWERLKPYQTGLIKGWKIVEANVGNFPHITYFHSANDLFRGLDNGRVDIVLYGKLIGFAVIRDLGLEDINLVSPPFASQPMFMYLHKRHANRMAALTEALRAMKRDGTYAAIVSQALPRDDKGRGHAHH